MKKLFSRGTQRKQRVGAEDVLSESLPVLITNAVDKSDHIEEIDGIVYCKLQQSNPTKQITTTTSSS